MIGASRSSTGSPASRAVASDTIAVATNGLDTDARWNIVSGVTGAPVPTSRTPNPRETTSSSRTTATARPATSCEPSKVSTSGHKPSSTLPRRLPAPRSTTRPYAAQAQLLEVSPASSASPQGSGRPPRLTR